MLGLALNVAVFFKVENAFAQTCVDGEQCTGTDTSTPPAKPPATPPAKSTSKSSSGKSSTGKKAAEKAEAELKKAQENYEKDPVVAANNKMIADKKQKLAEAEKAKDTKTAEELKGQIKVLEGQNEKSKAGQDKATAKTKFDKTIDTQKKSTDAAWKKAVETTETKKTALAKADDEVTKQQKKLAGMKPDDPNLQKEQKTLTDLIKKKDAAQKEYDKAKADSEKKYEDVKAVTAIGAKQNAAANAATANGGDPLSVATAPFPYVASPNAAHSFNVDSYLTISNEHGAYFKDGSHSSAVNFIIRAINIMVRVIGSVAMLILIIGGLILITAHGSEPMLEKGKDTIKYGLIGLVIALSSTLIIAFINNFLSLGTTG